MDRKAQEAEAASVRGGIDTASPLDEWSFLMGEWRGESEGQFGEEGTITSVATFSHAPSERFITGVGEATCEGRLVNRSVSHLYYDLVGGKFRRKTVFSYGFVNNEVECEREPGWIRFDITMEPQPKQFAGMRWRSWLRRIDDNHIAMGLEVAKGDGPFEPYGETVFARV